MKVLKLSQKLLNDVVKETEAGGVLICPTDTVYGFVADTGNKKAVEKIFKIKKRPKSKPLAVFVCSIKQARELAEINTEQKKYIKKYWPGKFTFILNKKKDIKIYNGTRNTVALRMPKDKFLLALIKKTGPLAQTSVNISGRPELNKISDIIKTFSNLKIKPDIVIDGGNLPKRKPSAIMDLTKNKLKYLRK